MKKERAVRVWDLKTQLELGKNSELEFIDRCHLDLHPSKTRTWDFITTEGLTVELKTDTYHPDKTENFFMERWSDEERGTVGGPWRTHEHGVDVFIYLFPKARTYFCFNDAKALVERLDLLTKDSECVRVRNIKWTTVGFKVKRKDLEDLYEVYTWEED